MMNQENMQEHLTKEALKLIVDNSPNYSDQVKQDLKISSTQAIHPKRLLKRYYCTFHSCI